MELKSDFCLIGYLRGVAKWVMEVVDMDTALRIEKGCMVMIVGSRGVMKVHLCELLDKGYISVSGVRCS